MVWRYSEPEALIFRLARDRNPTSLISNPGDSHLEPVLNSVEPPPRLAMITAHGTRSRLVRVESKDDVIVRSADTVLLHGAALSSSCDGRRRPSPTRLPRKICRDLVVGCMELVTRIRRPAASASRAKVGRTVHRRARDARSCHRADRARALRKSCCSRPRNSWSAGSIERFSPAPTRVASPIVEHIRLTCRCRAGP